MAAKVSIGDWQRIAEFPRHKHRFAEHLGEALHAANFVRGAADDRKLDASGHTDIAVKYLAHVHTEAERQQFQPLRRASAIQLN